MKTLWFKTSLTSKKPFIKTYFEYVFFINFSSSNCQKFDVFILIFHIILYCNSLKILCSRRIILISEIYLNLGSVSIVMISNGNNVKVAFYIQHKKVCNIY